MNSFEELSNIDGRTREGKAYKKTLDVTSVDRKPLDATEDSVARAEARLREIRQNQPDGDGSRDKFWAPSPPPGWDYQWKCHTVMGEEQSSYIVELDRQGWKPVPLSRYPSMMPGNWKGETIEVEGQVLMERPSILTEEARMKEARAAREAVFTKEQQLRSGRGSDLGPREVHRFNKSRSPIGVPSDE